LVILSGFAVGATALAAAINSISAAALGAAERNVIVELDSE
jgi:hypothetical protein